MFELMFNREGSTRPWLLPSEWAKAGEQLLLDLEEQLVGPLVPHPVGVEQGDEHVADGALDVPEQVLVEASVHQTGHNLPLKGQGG